MWLSLFLFLSFNVFSMAPLAITMPGARSRLQLEDLPRLDFSSNNAAQLVMCKESKHLDEYLGKDTIISTKVKDGVTVCSSDGYLYYRSHKSMHSYSLTGVSPSSNIGSLQATDVVELPGGVLIASSYHEGILRKVTRFGLSHPFSIDGERPSALVAIDHNKFAVVLDKKSLAVYDSQKSCLISKTQFTKDVRSIVKLNNVTLAIINESCNIITIWDFVNNRTLEFKQGGDIVDIAKVSSGKYLASVSKDKTLVILDWNNAYRKYINKSHNLPGEPKSLVVTSGDVMLVSIKEDDIVLPDQGGSSQGERELGFKKCYLTSNLMSFNPLWRLDGVVPALTVLDHDNIAVVKLNQVAVLDAVEDKVIAHRVFEDFVNKVIGIGSNKLVVVLGKKIIIWDYSKPCSIEQIFETGYKQCINNPLSLLYILLKKDQLTAEEKELITSAVASSNRSVESWIRTLRPEYQDLVANVLGVQIRRNSRTSISPIRPGSAIEN